MYGQPFSIPSSFHTSTPPLAGESQGGTTIALAIWTPERLQGPPELISTLVSELEGTPEAQVEPPAGATATTADPTMLCVRRNRNRNSAAFTP